MSPITLCEIERELAEMRQEIAQMRDEERAAWAVVLAYLEDRRKETRNGQANLDRAIDRLKNRLEE